MYLIIQTDFIELLRLTKLCRTSTFIDGLTKTKENKQVNLQIKWKTPKRHRIVCFQFRSWFPSSCQSSINKAVQLNGTRKKYPRESIQSLKSACYRTTIYLVFRTVCLKLVSWMCKNGSIYGAKNITPRKCLTSKGRKIRVNEDLVTLCQWCHISRFPWIDIANISKAFCGSPLLRIGEPLGTPSRKQNRYAFCPKT